MGGVCGGWVATTWILQLRVLRRLWEHHPLHSRGTSTPAFDVDFPSMRGTTSKRGGDHQLLNAVTWWTSRKKFRCDLIATRSSRAGTRLIWRTGSTVVSRCTPRMLPRLWMLFIWCLRTFATVFFALRIWRTRKVGPI